MMPLNRGFSFYKSEIIFSGTFSHPSKITSSAALVDLNGKS